MGWGREEDLIIEATKRKKSTEEARTLKAQVKTLEITTL
jgi:hypothetical protein